MTVRFEERACTGEFRADIRLDVRNGEALGTVYPLGCRIDANAIVRPNTRLAPVPVGCSVQRTVTVRSSYPGVPATVRYVGAPEFEFEGPATVVLGEGEGLDVQVTFRPTTPGPQLGSVQLVHSELPVRGRDCTRQAVLIDHIEALAESSDGTECD